MEIGNFRNPLRWIVEYFTGTDGVRLTAQDTLTLPAIWNGVSRISGHVSQLPLAVFRANYDESGEKVGGSKDRLHNAYQLLMRRPNAYQTPIVFREQLCVHSLLNGNGRAAIVRRGNRITELIPMLPESSGTGMLEGEKFHVCRPHEDDRLRLFFQPASEGKKDGLIVIDDKDVLHIPGLSTDGIAGIALKDIGRRNLGMAIAMEKRLNTQMDKGFSGSLMLEAPPGMFRKPEDAEEFLNYFEQRHNSPDKAGKVGMLREGMKANLMAMNNKEAEMTELRKFARQDAALWLGLEQILGDDSSVSYNSLEQKLLAYLMNCLNRWLKRWEEECEYKLLPDRQFKLESHYIRFNTAALLKSDYKTTVESLAQAIAATIISPNEARAKLDLNPREGGDAFINPAITPGDQAETPEEDEPAESAENPNQAAMKAVRARLAHLIGVEAQRVQSGATKSKNFLAWLDNFYSKKWIAEFADRLEEVGMDRELSELHCAESRRRLLEVCDYSQPENLVENVNKCVASWKSRANTLGELSHV
jgi:HK97 family phage portal protein